jgi:serine/threonine-protein kinase
MKALTKNPANRYQSAAEMRTDINRALQGATVAAPPVMAEPMTQPLTAITDPEPEEKSRKGAYIALVIGVLIALGLLGVGAWALMGGGTKNVAVPDVVGEMLPKAESTLSDAGFDTQVDTQTSDEKKNTVLTQDPAGNTEAAEGSTVTLVVSAGPEQVKVPDVVGLSQQTAIDQVQRAQLLVDTTPVDSDQAAGTVISTDPAGGTLVDAGSTVVLSVSTGEVEVPDVVGNSEAAATATLEAAGFNVTPVYVETDQARAGTVTDQSPSGGSVARLGTTVVLTIAQAPPTPTPTDTPTPTPSDTATNNGNGVGNPP